MYTPHTQDDREVMLKAIGLASMDDLFSAVPKSYRFPELALPPALTEMEIAAELKSIAAANENVDDLICFLGAGAYNHYVPAVVDSLLKRSEFYTAYTPYQPEISQGTLQSIFDYQSLIATLTGMEVSNASHYDGATALAEAAAMAYANFRGKRSRIVISPSVHPHYRQTIRTYDAGVTYEIVGDTDGHDLDGNPDELEKSIDINTALVIVQYPDFFGRVYDLSNIAKKAHEVGALLAVSVNPIALGLFTPPGNFGADIVTGEGQPLGLPIGYGGPYLGFFATRLEYVRKMAGRLVGETVDNRGQRAYVLTLTAREQHIRREKATSNICTNQALMALAATIYMSMLGKHGLRQVAELCYQKAHYAAVEIAKLPGFTLGSNAPFFNEFVVRCPKPVSEIKSKLLEEGVLGGYDLGLEYPGLENHLLIAVTEMNSREDIDYLVDLLAEVSND